MGSVAVRKTLHSNLTTILNRVDHHQTNPLTFGEVRILINRCNEIFKKCNDITDDLISQCTDEAGVIVQQSAFSPIEATYIQVAGKLEEFLQILPVPDRSGGGGGGNGSTNDLISVTLPSFDIPKFMGDYNGWLSFKDLFTASIGKHPKMSPAMKLQYLKGKLGEEPAKIIQGLLICDANFIEAWKLLEERYDNKREIVFSISRKLMDLKPVTTESATGLQGILDNATECLRSLKVMGIPTDSWDILIITIMLDKIDSATRREWAIRLTGTSVPTFQEFSIFLGNHIRGLIAAQSSTAVRGQRNDRVRSHYAATVSSCAICEGNHLPYKCDVLRSKTPLERSNLVRQHHLCYTCLNDHPKGKCQHNHFRCRKCNAKHHTLLHEPRHANEDLQDAPPATGGIPQDVAVIDNQTQTTSNHVSIASYHISTQQVLLSTAVGSVTDKNGAMQPCRIFLDPGSEASFITESCVSRLGLQKQPRSLSISGIGSSNMGNTRGMVCATLYSHYKELPPVAVDLHILPRITGLLPRVKLANQHWPHLVGLHLADPTYHQPQKVDILLGGDYCAYVMLSGRRVAATPDQPIAQESRFGWVISGQVPATTYSIRSHHIRLEGSLQFPEVENSPKVRILKKKVKAAEQHFKDNLSRTPTGRFAVGIPNHEKHSHYGMSKSTALRSYDSFERKLQRNPDHQVQYSQGKKYFALKQMEAIPPREQKEPPGISSPIDVYNQWSHKESPAKVVEFHTGVSSLQHDPSSKVLTRSRNPEDDQLYSTTAAAADQPHLCKWVSNKDIVMTSTHLEFQNPSHQHSREEETSKKSIDRWNPLTKNYQLNFIHPWRWRKIIPEEVYNASIKSLKFIPEQHLHDDINKRRKENIGVNSSKLRGFNSFVDYSGIMKMSSRLQAAAIPEFRLKPFGQPAKEPVVLSTSEEFLAALRRCIFHRGISAHHYFDRGTIVNGAKDKFHDVINYFVNDYHVSDQLDPVGVPSQWRRLLRDSSDHSPHVSAQSLISDILVAASEINPSRSPTRKLNLNQQLQGFQGKKKDLGWHWSQEYPNLTHHQQCKWRWEFPWKQPGDQMTMENTKPGTWMTARSVELRNRLYNILRWS